MLSLALVVLSALVWLVLRSSALLKTRQQTKLPPGPPRKLLIGNLGDLPSPDERKWYFWLKHKALYGEFSNGDVMSLGKS